MKTLSKIAILGLMVCCNLTATASNKAVIDLDYGMKDLQSVELNGAQIHYLSKGQGEPIILIHGAMCDYRYWEKTIESLSKTNRVIAFSSRHHFPNSSLTDLSDYTYENHVSDLFALIEFLDLPSVHLVGHSQGGNIAALAAIKRPDLVKSIVLEEGAFISDPGEDVLNEQQAVTGPLMAFPELAQQNKYEEIAKRFYDLTQDQGSFDKLSMADKKFSYDNVKTLTPQNAPSPMPLNCEELSSVKAPVLMIRGDSTPKFLEMYVDAGLECLDMESVTIEDVAHTIHSIKPKEFNKAVLQFLAGQ